MSSKPQKSLIQVKIITKQKIKPSIKKKERKKEFIDFSDAQTFSDFKADMNKYILSNELQQVSKMDIRIDPELAKITGLEAESVHSIYEVHEAAKKLFVPS